MSLLKLVFRIMPGFKFVQRGLFLSDETQTLNPAEGEYRCSCECFFCTPQSSSFEPSPPFSGTRGALLPSLPTVLPPSLLPSLPT